MADVTPERRGELLSMAQECIEATEAMCEKAGCQPEDMVLSRVNAAVAYRMALGLREALEARPPASADTDAARAHLARLQQERDQAFTHARQFQEQLDAARAQVAASDALGYEALAAENMTLRAQLRHYCITLSADGELVRCMVCGQAARSRDYLHHADDCPCGEATGDESKPMVTMAHLWATSRRPDGSRVRACVFCGAIKPPSGPGGECPEKRGEAKAQ